MTLERAAEKDSASPVVFTDSHAHLSMLRERAGLEAFENVLAAYDGAWRAAQASSHPERAPLVVEPGTLADDLPARMRSLGRRPWLRFAAGIWPAAQALEKPGPHLAALERAASLPDCVAIGEGGLDYHWMHGPKDAQRRLFEAQIDLSMRYKKALIVHTREAHRDTVDILSRAKPDTPVVIHCFGYDGEALREYLDLGCFVSFAGNLTFPSALDLREACALAPLDRLLLETDSPYLAPVPMRGKTCTPLLIGYTYRVAAELRGIGQDTLAEAVSANVRRVFG